LQLNIEWKESEKAGIMIMRRHFARYFPGLPHFRDLRIRLLRAETINEVNQILDEITEQFGSCRPDYNTTD
jgi:tRNA-dihydrouridine synthase B